MNKLKALILIVEDDYRTIKLLRDYLLATGYRVIVAGDGRSAIELAIQHKPALITMDLQLSGMNGLDATRALKANPVTRKIPIVALTAAAMKGQDEIVTEAGCSRFISKPFSLDSVEKAIEELLHQ